jgi:hypothetical protein
VSAGTDGFVAWIKAVYGEDIGTKACQWMEYSAVTDADHDPFTGNNKDVPPKVECTCESEEHANT